MYIFIVIQFHNLNISSSNFSNIKKKNYSYIFHFAAIVGVKNVIRKPFDVLVQNIDSLNKILNLAKNQKNLKRFIFTSSSEIYAGTLNNFGLKFPTPEKTILTLNNLDHQRSTYMLSKIYGEAMCHHSNIPFTISSFILASSDKHLVAAFITVLTGRINKS